MDKNNKIHNTETDIKIQFGNVIINLFCVNYEAPISGWCYGNHSHSSYELHFIPKGKGELRVNDKIYQIFPGTLYFTGPDVFHEQKADQYDPMCEYCLNFEILASKSKDKSHTERFYLLSEVNAFLETMTKTKFWFGRDDLLSEPLFEKILFELEDKVIGYHAYIQSLIMQIILNALRCMTNQKKSGYLIPKKELNDTRRYIIDKYFHNINQPLNPSELAEKIGTSVRQLNRILLNYYGLSFKQLLTSKRLELAKDLLINTNLSVEEISAQTGFASQNYFYKVFKSYFHISPSQYRIKKMGNV